MIKFSKFIPNFFIFQWWRGDAESILAIKIGFIFITEVRIIREEVFKPFFGGWEFVIFIHKHSYGPTSMQEENTIFAGISGANIFMINSDLFMKLDLAE